MELRVARAEDFDRLRALDGRAFVTPHRADLLRTRLRCDDCWIAEEGSYLQAYALRGEFFGLDFLELLYVGEAYRRHGVASALIGALERARRSDRLFASTNRSNAAMQTLLKKRGYARSGVIYNLDPGDPELMFVKRFDGVTAEVDT